MLLSSTKHKLNIIGLQERSTNWRSIIFQSKAEPSLSGQLFRMRFGRRVCQKLSGPGPTTYNPNSYGSFGTKGGFKIQKETSLTTRIKQMKHLLENPKEYYFQLGMSKEYS